LSKNRILVIGASGQIGSDLIPRLIDRYGNNNVIAGVYNCELPDDLKNIIPDVSIDVTKYDQIEKAIIDNKIDVVYNLASILSTLAEKEFQLAYEVNFNGTLNVFEATRNTEVKQLIAVSSIAAFGDRSPKINTPNDTIQNPNTIYGISKVFTELLGNYYFEKKGLDVRGVRFPGIISWKVEPTAGTTDYAVEIFYGAILNKSYTCFLGPDTRLPMMYMPDAISALISLSECDSSRLKHRVDYNVASMDFTPAELAIEIKRKIPDFEMNYEIDYSRQEIADSWPSSLDDSAARAEWDWDPKFNLSGMVDDMFENLTAKLIDGQIHLP
tara:strand:- start:11 stop:991 length:981 start_codon:yes stop_codon:yes gene_type:complete